MVSKLNPRIPRVWAPIDVPDHSVASTEFLILVPKESVSRKFLSAFCSSPYFCGEMELAASGTTGSHQRISPSSALNIAISIPLDPSEQTAIATILSDMDAEITALEARRDKTRDIKQGMMQELLTGRIRLV
ncbi:MAG: restriction endonuclease subunit S [Lamprocystis purpurea]|nr:restriction endonuclease subunit S [Lamprocystis purpurea]